MAKTASSLAVASLGDATAGIVVSIVPLWLMWLGELAIKRMRDGAPARER